jgi:hypothetical protein
MASKIDCVECIAESIHYHQPMNPAELKMVDIQSFNFGTKCLFVGCDKSITNNDRAQSVTFAMDTERHSVEGRREPKFYKGSWLMWGFDGGILMRENELMVVATNYLNGYHMAVDAGQLRYPDGV